MGCFCLLKVLYKFDEYFKGCLGIEKEGLLVWWDYLEIGSGIVFVIMFMNFWFG